MNNQNPLTEEEKEIMLSLYIEDSSSDDMDFINEGFYRIISNENVIMKDLRKRANKIIDIHRKFREYEYKKLRKEV